MSLPEIDAAFYFDLGCPLAYLAAEQLLTALGAPTSWRPVLASSLQDAQRFDAFRCATEADVFREEIARRAQALGLHGRLLRDRLPVRADDDPLRAARDPVGLGDLPTRVCPTRGGHAPRPVTTRSSSRSSSPGDDGQLGWRLAGTRGRIAAAGSIGNVVLGTILCAALLAACKMIIGPGTITALGSLIPVRRSAGRLLGRVDDHATLSATSRQD
jgi:hypothetical protein